MLSNTVCSSYVRQNIRNGQLTYNDNVYVNTEVPELIVTRPDDILICVRNGSRAVDWEMRHDRRKCDEYDFWRHSCRSFALKHSWFIFHTFQAHDIQRQIHETSGRPSTRSQTRI